MAWDNTSWGVTSSPKDSIPKIQTNLDYLYNSIGGSADITAAILALSKSYTDTKVAAMVDSAPETLDTLQELAAALGDDPHFATTITNLIGTKAPLANPTFTGTTTLPQTTSIGATTSTELGYLHGVTSDIQTQLNAKLPLNGVPSLSKGIVSIDDRSTPSTPTDYSQAAKLKFKFNTSIGSPDPSLYSSVLGLAAWDQTAGLSGGPAHELVFSGNGNLFYRHGSSNTTWTNWRQIATLSGGIYTGAITGALGGVANTLINSSAHGVIELGDLTGNATAGSLTPFIDWHYAMGSLQDYNIRQTNDRDGAMTFYGNTTNALEIACSGRLNGVRHGFVFGATGAYGYLDYDTSGSQVRLSALNNLVFGFNSAAAHNSGTFTERMRLDGSGNLGLGTASPYNANGTNAEIYNASSSARLWLTSGSTSRWFSETNASGRYSITDFSSGGGINRLSIWPDGHVVIGAVPTHTQSLTLGEGIMLIDPTGSDVASGNGLWITPTGGTTYKGFNWQMGTDGSANMYVGNEAGWIRRLSVLQNGNVTVGSPARSVRNLNIGGVQYAAAVITSSSASGSVGESNLYFGNAAVDNAGVINYNHATNNMTLWANGLVRLLIAGSNGATVPGANNAYTLGNASFLWSQLYAATATINTSDRNAKTNIKDLDLGLDFILAQRPVEFKYLVRQNVVTQNQIGTETIEVEPERTEIVTVTPAAYETVEITPATYDEEGNVITEAVKEERLVTEEVTKEVIIPAVTEERPVYEEVVTPLPGIRPHAGLIAQEVEETLNGKNIGLYTVGEDGSYGLRYEEFIAPLIKAVQELSQRIKELESKISA